MCCGAYDLRSWLTIWCFCEVILKARNLKVADKLEEWPRELRRASINSFGYGGANAHVILESAESFLGQDYLAKYSRLSDDLDSRNEQKLLVLPISAESSNSLRALVPQVSQAVSQCRDWETIQNLAHTIINGRDRLRQRSFILAKYEGGSGKVVYEMAEGEISKRTANPLPFGFVFTGQGAQYSNMAKELILENQNFCNTIRRLDAVLQALPTPHTPHWTLEQLLLGGDSSQINEATCSQPICTAVQVGLIDLLKSWGVRPTSVVGHSSGEIAAAYAANLLTFSQAILVAYFRGYVVGETPPAGAMMAVGLDYEEAKLVIESKGLEAQVNVACINAPQSVTLSGSSAGIDVLMQELQSKNKFARRLETGGRAYHSHLMKEIGPSYEELLTPFFDNNNDKSASLVNAAKMYSSVGHSSDKLVVLDHRTNMPAYWRKNLEQPVQFAAALANLVEGGSNTAHLIEIGPHAALKGPIKQIRTGLGLDEKALPYSSTLSRNQDADFCMKVLAGELFTQGHQTLNWDNINSFPESGLRILHSLTPYPWDYSGGLLWSEPRASVEMRNRIHLRHELLGTLALTGNGIDFTWRNLLRLSEIPWLRDHKLEDQIVFPAAGYIALAIEAVSQISGVKDKLPAQLAFEFRNVNINTALNIPDDERDVYSTAKDLELHTTMSARKISNANSSADWHDFSVSSWLTGRATTHCTGSVRLTEPRKDGTADKHSSVMLRNTDDFDVWSTSRWYTKWHQEGLCFGPHFQSLSSLRTDGGRRRREAIGVTRLQPSIPKTGSANYPVHPVTIDAALQAAILSTTAGRVSALKTWLPVFIAECRIQPTQETLASRVDGDSEADGVIHSLSEETGVSSRRIDGTLWDPRGIPVVDFKGGRISLYTGKKEATTQQSEQLYNNDGTSSASVISYIQRQPTLRIHWKPDVLRLRPEAEAQLRDYVAVFIDQQHDDLRDDESLAAIGALLDLAGHKNPSIRVLELGGDVFGYKGKQWQSMLDKDTAFPRYHSWHSGNVTDDGDIKVEREVYDGPFDVILIPRVSRFAI